MSSNFSNRQFVVIEESINLQKSFNGLFAYVHEKRNVQDIFDDICFVFINRRRNMFKCLYWENDSLSIWQKRLNKGTFSKIVMFDKPISYSELLLFIHGIIPPQKTEKS